MYDGFDPEFYRSANADLPSQLSDRDLLNHYADFGKAEGRACSPAEYIAQLEAQFGPLPIDFDALAYGRLNPDVSALYPNVWGLARHYLEQGVREGRDYNSVDMELYRALNNLSGLLSRADLLDHYKSNAGKPEILTSAADYMVAKGVNGGGRWLSVLDVKEFRTLNWSWLPGGIATKLDAADALLEFGLDRMAGIAFDHQFEAEYYREIHPELAARGDAELYRHWLFIGLEEGEAASVRGRLRQLGLDLPAFPEGFDWRSYALRAKPRRAGRWAALAHYLREGKDGLPPVRPEGAGDFLIAASKAFAIRNDEMAIQLLEQAAKLAPLVPGALQNYADSQYRRMHFARAAELYLESFQSGFANIWTVSNGLQSLLATGDTERATALMLGAADRFRGEARFRLGAEHLVRALFDKAEREARLAYLDGRRAIGDATLLDAVDRLEILWRRLDPIGAPLPRAGCNRVVMLANTDIRQCTHYRVEQKIEVFDAAKVDFEVFSVAQIDEFLSALPGASMAIFYRLAAFPGVVRAIGAARAMQIPTYYEVDDRIFDDAYPDPIETYAGSISPEDYAGLQLGVPLFRAAMQRCDFGIASTPALAKVISPWVREREVFVLPNGLDSRNTPWLRRRDRVRQDNDLVIFYGSGTRAHSAEFWTLAADALCEVLDRYPSARLVIAGFLPLDGRLKTFQSRVTQIPFIPDIQSYWAILAEADINLAVLNPGPTTDGKSEIKWLEAAAVSVPSIVSDTEAYRDALEDGVDVLFARNAVEWKSQLMRLAGDAGLRRSIAKAAKRRALSTYGLKANADRLRDHLAASRIRRPPPRSRETILLVNTFFPPQTIGGATRVVRDNLNDFLNLRDMHPFDFAVAASDNADHREGMLRVEAYRGVPVFRVATPAEPNMDWRAVNPEVGEVFGRVLDVVKPALVHFHATQRLTASAVEECFRRGVPYVITAHDAWWISDHQFLTNAHDEVVTPGDVFGDHPPDGVTIGESLLRQSRLRRFLNQASGVFGVSHDFTTLYRRAGVDAIPVLNGVPSMIWKPRQTTERPVVRLAHIGGRSFHKGYPLVEAAFREGRFSNLELTVVDHSRLGGDARVEFWGATEVRFVGMTPQEEMPNFYMGQDLLLAPSVWPESFGLVAREALQAGLWVVASDRGAMAEDVVEGVNGHVVDVSSPQSLFQVLSKINANPHRYKTSPPPPCLRPSIDQARDLLSIYETLLKSRL